LKLRKTKSKILQTSLLVIVVVSLVSGSFVFSAEASPTSAYHFKFTVNGEGFTNVEIKFNSTAPSGSSWVFVPNSQEWVNTTLSGKVTKYKVTGTKEVPPNVDYYFYRALQFDFQSTGGLFSMNILFNMSTGALILGQRGIFYSPQIGYQSNSATAEVFLDTSLSVVQTPSLKAVAVGNRREPYSPNKVDSHYVFFNLQENLMRIQVEFRTSTSSEPTLELKSKNNVFTFKTVTRYQNYTQNVLKLYDRIYSYLTRLFNVTLDNIAVQFFLPDFGTLLTVGGFVPFTGEQLGEINLNIFFIRAINGTVEVIAMHELVHHFLSKAGLSPSNFLWFHEGMAQYLSVTLVMNLGYEGATSEKDNLENGARQLIQDLNGENFSELRLQYWSPSYQPPNVKIEHLYVASYYVISQLPQIVQREGLDYYERFFELIGQLPPDINGVKIKNIDVLALYLSKVANASVASNLKLWGFTVTDLSPIGEITEEAGKAIVEVNPVFQPYRFLAEYFYQQALLSAGRGDWERAESLLQLAITMANLAPLFTFLTIIAILALLVYILARRSKRPRPMVPPPPPEILQPAA